MVSDLYIVWMDEGKNNMKTEHIILLTAFFMGVILIAVPQVDHGYIQMLEENKEWIYASTAIGMSMEPTISSGDRLLVLKKDSPDFHLDTGDIVVYLREDMVIAHRLVSRNNCNFFVKGDNSEEIEQITCDQIIGKVIKIL